MNDKCLLVTPNNIQDELIKNEIEQNRLQFESFKEQKYNEILREYKQLQNNWNELKKWLEEESKLKGSETAYLYYGNVLEKIKDLPKTKTKFEFSN